jgi:hypothetical protein
MLLTCFVMCVYAACVRRVYMFVQNQAVACKLLQTVHWHLQSISLEHGQCACTVHSPAVNCWVIIRMTIVSEFQASCVMCCIIRHASKTGLFASEHHYIFLSRFGLFETARHAVIRQVSNVSVSSASSELVVSAISYAAGYSCTLCT